MPHVATAPPPVEPQAAPSHRRDRPTAHPTAPVKPERFTLIALQDLTSAEGALVSANVKQRFVDLEAGPVLKVGHPPLPTTGLNQIGPEPDRDNVEQLLALTRALHPRAKSRFDEEQDSWVIYLPA